MHVEEQSELEAGSAINTLFGEPGCTQAAEEQGWIRVKPLTQPTESTIYAETLAGEMTAPALWVIGEAAGHCGCPLVVLESGALENRAKEITP